jgi:hypothetical protein
LHKPSPPEINRNDVELINFQVKIPQPHDIGQKGWRLWVAGLGIFTTSPTDVSTSGRIACGRLDQKQSFGEFPEQLLEGIV